MDDWRSYDDVAVTYERIHAPRFADPARDLLALTGVTAGMRVLDVGTGTGVAAAIAAEGGADPTGVDASVGMLEVGRAAHPGLRLAAAEAIDLPFATGTFDAVVGNFVLAHFTKVDTALFDLVRVARPGGSLGFTTWADARDTFTDTWVALVSDVVPSELLDPSVADAVPNHERFKRREAVEEALHDAGLRHVRTEAAQYEWSYALDDYLDGLEVWALGRFVKEMLGDGWEAFRAHARDVFASRFPDPLHDKRDVLLAVGTKE
ncbi:MAG TPA: methyltransferase domain-containing protein [Actinomycetota bacterium]|nr:methyltransferase domain-containing protein [Actinomycetota bacterium]